MAIRKDESVWRQKRWDWYGESLFMDMQAELINKKFRVKHVSKLPTLDHLAEATAYDVASAVLSYLEHDNKIKRLGAFFKLKGEPRNTKYLNLDEYLYKPEKQHVAKAKGKNGKNNGNITNKSKTKKKNFN